MRLIVAGTVVILAMGGCGDNSGTTAPNTHCIDGSAAGPIATDPTTDPGCQHGGRCELVTSQPCDAGTTDAGCAPEDGGTTTSWSCVYPIQVTGNANVGRSSSPGNPDLP
jgi:hypothetical protein